MHTTLDAAAAPDLLQLLRDLDGQLARGRERDRLHDVQLRVDLLHDRDAERGGLARAGARLDDQVLAGLGARDGLGLDVRGLPVALGVEAGQRLGGQVEAFEASARSGDFHKRPLSGAGGAPGKRPAGITL